MLTEDLERKFHEYFNELERFSLRSERFADDVKRADFMVMREWMKSAYTQGCYDAMLKPFNK